LRHEDLVGAKPQTDAVAVSSKILRQSRIEFIRFLKVNTSRGNAAYWHNHDMAGLTINAVQSKKLTFQTRQYPKISGHPVLR
jgi:hypothetical protein